ncbi:MAG: efflux transporter outer membrane subunit [Caulobacterales bacterium]
MNRASRLALGLAVAASLAACKTVGPNFHSPAAPTSAGYLSPGEQIPAEATLSPQTRVAGAWWRSFGSADLDRVMREALANNPTLAAADATLERARDQVAAARGAQQPQVTLGGIAERERINFAAFGFTGFPNPTINLFTIGPTVVYDPDLFGGRRRQVESAQAQADAAARRADVAYLTLTGNVALQALQIASARAQLNTLDQVLAGDRENIAMVKRAEAQGGEAPSATAGGEAQLAADEALRPPLEQQLSMGRHALALLVGKSPAEWSAPDFDLAAFATPAPVPVSLPSELVHRRPDIQAAEADLHAATAEIGVAAAKAYPDINLSANVTQGALTPVNLFGFGSTGWTLASQLSMPLLNGGALAAQRRAAEADARVYMARYQQTVLTAFGQVADVMQAIRNDDEEIAALRHAIDAAQSHLLDTQNAYRLGGGPMLGVIDAQRQVNQARRALVAAQGRRMADIAQLYTATASDWRAAPAG